MSAAARKLFLVPAPPPSPAPVNSWEELVQRSAALMETLHAACEKAIAANTSHFSPSNEGAEQEVDFSLTPPMPRPLRNPLRGAPDPGKRDPAKPRRERKPPVSLKDEQLLALLGRARERRPRDWVMILVTYWHGLRASETLALQESDFDLRDGTVRIVRGKGSDGGLQTLMEHENPLLNERAAVEWWLANRGQFGRKGGAKQGAKIRQSTKNVRFSPAAGVERLSQGEKPAGGNGPPGASKANSGPGNDAAGHSGALPDPPIGPIGQNASSRLFPINRGQFWHFVHCYALAVGIPRRKCKTHMLKHTIAKNLIRAGVPVNEVQAWLGWKSIETANWYLIADEEELGERVGSAIRAKVGFRQMQQGSFSF